MGYYRRIRAFKRLIAAVSIPCLFAATHAYAHRPCGECAEEGDRAPFSKNLGIDPSVYRLSGPLGLSVTNAKEEGRLVAAPHADNGGHDKDGPPGSGSHETLSPLASLKYSLDDNRDLSAGVQLFTSEGRSAGGVIFAEFKLRF